MEGFLLLMLVMVAVWLVVRVLSSSSELQQVRKQIWPQKETILRLEKQIKELQDEVRALQPSQQSSIDLAAPAAVPAQGPGAGEEAAPASAAAEKPAVVEKDVWAVTEAAYRSKTELEAEPSLPGPPVQEPPVIPAEAPPAPVASEPAPGETPSTEQPAAPPPPSPRAPAWEMPKFDWEGLIGVKLFSWIAGVAMVVAAIFFLNYSIDRGWLQPPVQMTIGIIAGLGLLLLCELKAANKYRITANAMDASAVAILFATFYAAYALWHLINPGVSFIFLVLVAVVAVLLSIRRDSMFIALLGLIGGFATPALLSSGENHPITLFGYLLLLNAGLAWVAAKKRWPLLTILTLVLTTLYQWGWVMKFLTAEQLPLSIGIFLVFPVLTFVALTLGPKEETGKGWISLYGKSATLSALFPVLFAAYLASVSGYGSHYVILFGFLFVLAAGLFAIALARGREILHLAGGISTLLVFAIWVINSYDSAAWPVVLAFILLFVLFYLGAPLIAGWFGRGFTGPGSGAVYVAPLLLSLFAVLAAIEPLCAAPGFIFAVLFLLLAAVAAFAIFQEQGGVYFLAAFFALVAEAVWSDRYLTAERLLSGLTIYGIFGLFYVGVPMAARRWRKALRPEGAGAVLVLISVALLFFIAHGGIAVWGLALLLLILNLGLMLEGSASRLPHISIVGIVLSWAVLGYFWTQATLTDILIPALVVVAGFAVLAMVGMIWLQRQTTGDDVALLGNGVFLGLVGHLFLFVVASQRSLAIHGWSLLGVLFVLDLAVGAAVLYTRRHVLLMGAIVASAVILMAWVGVVGIAPWPSVGILSAGALVLYSFIWFYLIKRIGIESGPYADAAVIAIILAQIVAIISAQQPGSPGVGFLITAHLLFLVTLLGVAWFRSEHFLVVLAIMPTAVAVSLWMWQHSGPEFWQSQLLFAGLIYLVFLSYPLLLGRRAGRSLEPYLAAVLASVPFFFQARSTIMVVGWGDIIGVLPILQAVLMAGLLVNLLHIEPRGARVLGRLALVAGAALAFVTAAIPLQLEKQWITIAWALEGAALAWLYRKIPHRGLLFTTAGLLVIVFARLAVIPLMLDSQPRGALPIWNWYLYTYLVAALAMILAGWLLAKTQDSLMDELPRASTLLPAGGALLLFILLNIEIADFYSVGEQIVFRFSATLAQDMTYTIGWALFGVALLAVGIAICNHAARIASLVLLVATIVKCFLHDLASLGGLYRVMSFVGLAICLALVALALQKFVLAARKEAS